MPLPKMRKQDICGTFARYKVGGCRCPKCREAHRVYAADRRRQIAYGRWNPWVDATPVREHVRELQRQGMGRRRIGALAGVDQSMIWRLEHGIPSLGRGPTSKLRKATADRVLAVQAGLDAVADSALIDATGTHRRIQALVAAGWSLSKIALRLGVQPANMSTTMSRTRLYASTVRAVRGLYDELWDCPSPAGTPGERAARTQAYRFAAERGWAPPLAWDDETIDDPEARPSGVRRSGSSSGLTSQERSERRAVVAALSEAGLSAREIGDRVGISRRSVVRDRAALAKEAAA